MRRLFTTVAAATGSLTLAGALLAQTAAPAPTARMATRQDTKAEQQLKAEPTLTGSIEKFDATAKLLIIKGKKGEAKFTVAADCAVAEGAKKLAVDDLAGLVGQPAKVYYTGSGRGTMTAHLIRIEKPRSGSNSTAKSGEARPVKR